MDWLGFLPVILWSSTLHPRLDPLLGSGRVVILWVVTLGVRSGQRNRRLVALSPSRARLSESLDPHPNTTITGSNQPTASCLLMLDRLKKTLKVPGREFVQGRIGTE